MPKSLRKLVRAGAVALGTGFLAARFYAERTLSPENASLAIESQTRWFRFVLDVCNVYIRLGGAPPPKGSGGRLVVSNHRSAIDVAVLGVLFPSQLLSRADVASWPILGRAARDVGTIFVDRGHTESRANAARTIRERLLAGSAITLFPEGTTFGDDEVRPFQRGAFLAAAHSEIPVIPVGLAYERGCPALYTQPTFLAHADALVQAREIRVAVRVGSALSAREVRANNLAGVAQEEVQRLVRQARADCDAWSGA